MRNVFKYFEGKWGLEALRNLEIKVTPPNELNDIFEFSPRVVCSKPERVIRQEFRKKDFIRRSYEQDRRDGSFSGNWRDYRRAWPALAKKLFEPATSGLINSSADMQKLFASEHSKHLGVACFTSAPDSVVMWSHYADKHRGIVIEFDGNSAIFHEGKGLRLVKYVVKRPIWDTAAVVGRVSEKEQIDPIILHKNDEWSYEKELRQLYLLPELRRRTLENGSTAYFREIPAESIVSVRIGMRCQENMVHEIAKLCQRLPDATLKQAIPSDTDFAMTTRDFVPASTAPRKHNR